MKKVCMIFCCILMLSYGTAAAENVTLFKDFFYGMSKENIEKKVNIAPYGNSNGKWFYSYPVKFINKDWEQIFVFENNKLQIIFLARDLELNIYQTVSQSIIKNGFVPLGIKSDDKICDIIEVAKRSKNRSDMESEINKFELSALHNKKIVSVYIEDKIFQKNFYKVNNAMELMKIADDRMREVDIIIDHERIMIKFFAPQMAIKYMQEQAGEEHF